MQLNDSSNITSLGAAASRQDPRKRQDHLPLQAFGKMRTHLADDKFEI